MVTTRRSKEVTVRRSTRINDALKTKDANSTLRKRRRSTATPANVKRTTQTPANVLDLQLDSGATTQIKGKVRTRITSNSDPTTRKKLKRSPRLGHHLDFNVHTAVNETTKNTRNTTPNIYDDDNIDYLATNIDINSLPRSVLAEIFKHIDVQTRVKIVPCVCRRWASVLRNSSPAWTTMDLYVNNPNPIQSQRHSKYAEFSEWACERIKFTKDLCIFAQARQRSDSESIRQMPWIKAITTIAQTCTSALEKLHIHVMVEPTIVHVFARGAKNIRDLHLKCIKKSDGAVYHKFFKTISQFSELEHLRLAVEDGTEELGTMDSPCLFPDEVCKLVKLKTLSLSGFGFVRTIPAQCCRLVNLEFLELKGNRLSHNLPSTLANLSKLTSLTIEGNQGDAFDNQLNKVIIGCLPNLISLSLIDCQLSSFSVCQVEGEGGLDGHQFTLDTTLFPKLETLNLSKNPLGPIPRLAINIGGGNFTLRQLYIDNCGLSTVQTFLLPDFFPELIHLSLKSNNLVDLPDNLGMDTLTGIDLSNNAFPAIPLSALEGMGCLSCISIKGCPYLEISSSLTPMIKRFPHLHRFDASKSTPWQKSSLFWLNELVEESRKLEEEFIVTF